MATTTNFGWETPDDTDLVKDGAAAIRTALGGVDTSFVDLKGGTTGQILSKASNTDLDYTWITNDVGDITGVTAGTGISGGGTSGAVTITNSMATEITAKADLIVGTGNATFDNLPVGANGTVLTADSSVSPTGLKWAAASSGAFTLIKRASFSAVATTSTTFQSIGSATYKTYMVVFEKMYAATAADDFQMQLSYGATTAASGYYGSYTPSYSVSGAVSSVGYRAATETTLAAALGASGSPGNGFLYITALGVSALPTFNGQYFEANTTNEPATTFGGGVTSAQVYDGFVLKSSSSNITGTVSVYGLATS